MDFAFLSNRKTWLRFRRMAVSICVYGMLLFCSAKIYGCAKEARREKYYTIVANIKKTDGLKKSAAVLMSGVNVGFISGMELEPDFSVSVSMSIKKGVLIPEDSSAAIYTDGLLGAKYIAILPGGSTGMMGDGDSFGYTQNSVNITEMIELGIHNFSKSRK